MATESVIFEIREDGSRVVRRNIDEIGRSSGRAGTAVESLKRALIALGGIETLRRAVSEAIKFRTAMEEVSTLLPNSVGQMAQLTEQSKRLAIEFGSMPIEQSRAFYQAISAGAANASEATKILRQSNKLAVGGVTDITTAVDGLTTALNSYQKDASHAADISDALFIAMRAGKTTVGELSSGIGRVTPLAAKLGVSFDELVAATAALTKGGISTAESLTGLRAILATVTKPSQEAAELAAAIGLEFNAAAIKAKGFTQFLDDVVAKTGGSTEQLSILFGGVEAIVPALSLAGAAGKDFDEIMADMAEKAGATEEAFRKMQGPGFQLRRTMAAMNTIAIDLGDSLVTALNPAMERFADSVLEARQNGESLDILLAASADLWSKNIDSAKASIVGFENEMEFLAQIGTGSIDLLSDAFLQFPQNVSDAIKIVTVELASFIDKITIRAKGVFDVLAERRRQFKPGQPNEGISFQDALAEADKRQAGLLSAKEQARQDSIDAILQERDANLKAFQDRMGQLKAERDLINQMAQDRSSLAGSGSSAEGGSGSGSTFKSRESEFDKILNGLRAENDALELNNSNQRVSAQLIGIKRILTQELTDVQEQAIREELEMNEALSARAAVIDRLKGPMETFRSQVQAIIDLQNEGALSSGQSAQALLGLSPELLEGTSVALDAARQKYQDTLAQVDRLRQDDLINEQTANAIKLQAQVDLNEARLAKAQEFFGGLSALQSSESKKAAAVGKAAAIAQATINTYQAATGAYAAMASIPYVGPVLGVIAAAAAIAAGLSNIQKIRSTPTGRALGGDLDRNQLSRVGEGVRPEIFRTTSGQQFFIPPERGRVEPLRPVSAQRQSSQNQRQQVQNTNNFNFTVNAREGFVRPEAKRQIEAAAYRGMRRAYEEYQ